MFRSILFQVAFFNNYLMDPKRPQLPEHPGNKGAAASPAPHPPGPQYPSPGGNYGGHPPMGYNHPRPQMMRGGYGGMNMIVKHFLRFRVNDYVVDALKCSTSNIAFLPKTE